MRSYFISFGSNKKSVFGCPIKTLSRAIEDFGTENLTIVDQSNWYFSPAFPDSSQPRFVNGCLEVKSTLDPHQVLRRLNRIERKMGRTLGKRWEARVCDLDILSCENLITPNLRTFNYWFKMPFEEQLRRKPTELLLPHPRLQDRAFVLVPFAEIAKDWLHPVFGISVEDMLARLSIEMINQILPIKQ